MNLCDVLDASVRRFPTHTAVEWGTQSIQYAELQARANQAATVLADHGVRKGDRVMVMTLNDPGFIIAAYGVWRLGAVLVPVNHKLTAKELTHIAQHARATFGIVSDALKDVARQGVPDIEWLTTGWEPGTFEEAYEMAAAYTGPLVDETEYAEVIYTSGSTGTPKGCVLTHRAVSAGPPNIVSNMPFSHEDRMLICMPIWHASPLNNWVLTTIFVGGTIVLTREYDPASFLSTLEDCAITAVFGAPIAFIAPVQLAQTGKVNGVRQPNEYDLSRMKMMIYGAAPLGEEMARMLISAYGTENFYQVY